MSIKNTVVEMEAEFYYDIPDRVKLEAEVAEVIRQHGGQLEWFDVLDEEG